MWVRISGREDYAQPFMKNENNQDKIKLLKKDIRKEYQERRNNLSAEYRAKSSRSIEKKFLKTDYYINSENILIYFPFRSEVNTTRIIKKALEDRKKIILPRVYNNKLKLFFVTNPSEQLEKGSYNIMEPITVLCRPAKTSDIDVAIVPGISFDRDLNRLGYGGGYYDRLFKNIPERVKKIALCFDVQVSEKIPVSRHDIRVDMLITESKIYRKE